MQTGQGNQLAGTESQWMQDEAEVAELFASMQQECWEPVAGKPWVVHQENSCCQNVVEGHAGVICPATQGAEKHAGPIVH